MRSGIIRIEEGQNNGEATIELNIADQPKYDAINNQSTLYIKEDIESETFIISQGEYSFNFTIDANGGYTLPVTKK